LSVPRDSNSSEDAGIVTPAATAPPPSLPPTRSAEDPDDIETAPPSFSSLFSAPDYAAATSSKASSVQPQPTPPEPLPDFTAATSGPQPSSSSAAAAAAAAAASAVKAALPRDTKDQSQLDDSEPPPPYFEGDSPIKSFSWIMASAGGPSSIITQVSQGSGQPIASFGGIYTGASLNQCLWAGLT
jgi:ATP-binding cassette subfamily F protein 3